MTNLRNQLARLLGDEPEAPYDIEQIMRRGRSARRRHHAVLAAAGTVGAAGLTAAVVIPVVATAGDQPAASLELRSSPAPTPSAQPADCYFIAARPATVKHAVGKLVRSGKVGRHPSVTTMKGGSSDQALREVCAKGATPAEPHQGGQPSAGPKYSYAEQPEAIASRLGAELHERVSGLGLSISFTRPFSQETSTLDAGRPSYFGGNVDVHEATGYGDVGVQVTHRATHMVPFTGSCTVTAHCAETTLADGGVLQTGEVSAGKREVVLTADVHRPDGVVVHAQESNYPFGPGAGSQPHGDQPLTLDQLVTLAEDNTFTF
jgi:hypothetical protein